MMPVLVIDGFQEDYDGPDVICKVSLCPYTFSGRLSIAVIIFCGSPGASE